MTTFVLNQSHFLPSSEGQDNRTIMVRVTCHEKMYWGFRLFKFSFFTNFINFLTFIFKLIWIISLLKLLFDLKIRI